MPVGNDRLQVAVKILFCYCCSHKIWLIDFSSNMNPPTAVINDSYVQVTHTWEPIHTTKQIISFQNVEYCGI
jgi:hypothetical protein